eukprot:scpid37911/ scgid17698/ Eukaryotic translation initiation factor 3 subunit B; Eukaryotic translation initiation factor 3 subunit 9; eIF-3-eta; eIF3 p116
MELSEQDLEISDDDLMQLTGLKKPKAISGIEAAIVVDNVPRVDGARQERLKGVIMKIMSRFGKIVGEPFFPADEQGNTKGYVFLEYSSEAEAVAAVKTADGYKLDKGHVFTVNLLTDFEHYQSLPETFEPPKTKEFVSEGNLRSWLMEPDARDQYVVHAGDTCTVFSHSAEDADYVFDRKYWTAKYLRWTPQGTYVASLHDQGVIMWGGDKFERKLRLAHSRVQLIDFSPCERYAITFNGAPDNEASPDAIAVWDLKRGHCIRRFNAGENKEWPIFRWNFDGSLFARMSENLISVYESVTCSLLDKESFFIKGIRQFSWSPSDNIIAYWTPEESSIPARVALMEIPSRQEIRTMNLFSVADCKIVWHGQGDYLAVKVDRFANSRKKVTIANFEIFRIREKNIPVEKIELKDAVQGFAWEPHGNKFAVIHELQGSPGVCVSFYEMETDKLKLIKMLEKKLVSHIFWSPRGQFVVLAGLKQSNGILEFYDTSDMTMMNVSEHLMATDIAWDPTGRYLVSSVSTWYQKVDTGYIVWSLHGQPLQRHSVDGFCELHWRPRPKSLLSEEEVKRLKRDLKKTYTPKFDSQDRKSRNKASKAEIEKRQQLMAQFKAYRARVTRELAEEEPRLRELRGDMDQDDGEYDEEVVEYLVNVEEVVLK